MTCPSEVHCMIQLNPTSEPWWVHVNKLKPHPSRMGWLPDSTHRLGGRGQCWQWHKWGRQLGHWTRQCRGGEIRTFLPPTSQTGSKPWTGETDTPTTQQAIPVTNVDLPFQASQSAPDVPLLNVCFLLFCSSHVLPPLQKGPQGPASTCAQPGLSQEKAAKQGKHVK